MPAGDEVLRPPQRIRRRRDFQRVSREGARVRSRSFVALVAGREVDASSAELRLGVTVSRRVGNSVGRNRVKRGIREWFRRHRELWPAGRDIVIIARRGAAERASSELGQELEELAQQASVRLRV